MNGNPNPRNLVRLFPGGPALNSKDGPVSIRPPPQVDDVIDKCLEAKGAKPGKLALG